jgi:hypothetical protein
LALRYGSDIYIKRKSSELSSQYIHRPNTQNDSPVIKKGIASLIKCLENAGYQTIREIKENNNIQT